MRTLHHWTLDPLCRQVRLALGEKKLDFKLADETPWNPRPEFLAVDPGGLGPVLTRDEATPVIGSRAILEYLEEVHPDPALYPADLEARAESRRLIEWFDRKFATECGAVILQEKIVKRAAGLGSPDMEALRGARERVRWHMDYMAWLLEKRDWLSGPKMSLADLCVAAHLSVTDFLGEAPWDDFEGVKDWYVKLKSRPCFRPLLTDRVPGLTAPPHYADLDF